MSTGNLRIAGGLCAVALALGAAACGSGGSTSSSTTSAAAGKPASGGKPLTVGISLSLSGDFSDPGNAALRGYKLWAEVNAKGGILGRRSSSRSSTTSSPTRSSPTTRPDQPRSRRPGLRSFSTLLSVPAAAVAERYGYAFVEPAGGGPGDVQREARNVFFVQPAPVVGCGQPFVGLLLSLPASQRPKTAAYPSLDDPSPSPIADAMQTSSRPRGQDRVTRSLPAGDEDLTPIIRRSPRPTRTWSSPARSPRTPTHR